MSGLQKEAENTETRQGRRPEKVTEALERENDELRAALAALEASEKRLRQVQAELEGRVSERSEELEQVHAQLVQSQKMEAIGTLAGGVAHDFNNILMGIQGNAYLAKEGMGAAHPHLDKLENIERYVERGARLTRQLLGFARREKSEFRTTDLNETVENTCQMFASTHRELQVKRKPAPGLLPVKVDPAQIEQVLLNLLVNAGQAAGSGGVVIVETANEALEGREASLAGVGPGLYVRLSVSDNGPGIDPAVERRIFDPFFTTRDVGKGSGLGLAMAYGIVRNHGGMISATGRESGGAAFRVLIPAVGSRAGDPADAASRAKPSAATILLVDDEEMILQTVGGMLEKMGHRAMTASTGMEALAQIAEDPEAIDLVILDLIMPEMGGEETCRRIRRIDHRIDVLLSSGYSASIGADRLVEGNCRGFIQKPYTFEKLSSKIGEILGSRRLAGENWS